MPILKLEIKLFTYMFGLFKDKYKNFQNCTDYLSNFEKLRIDKNNN